MVDFVRRWDRRLLTGSDCPSHLTTAIEVGPVKSRFPQVVLVVNVHQPDHSIVQILWAGQASFHFSCETSQFNIKTQRD